MIFIIWLVVGIILFIVAARFPAVRKQFHYPPMEVVAFLCCMWFVTLPLFIVVTAAYALWKKDEEEK